MVGFHDKTSGQIAPRGLVKQGDEEESPTYRTIVNDGFQYAEPPGLREVEQPTTQGTL